MRKLHIPHMWSRLCVIHNEIPFVTSNCEADAFERWAVNPVLRSSGMWIATLALRSVSHIYVCFYSLHFLPFISFIFQSGCTSQRFRQPAQTGAHLMIYTFIRCKKTELMHIVQVQWIFHKSKNVYLGKIRLTYQIDWNIDFGDSKNRNFTSN